MKDTLMILILTVKDKILNLITWGYWGWKEGNKSSRARAKGVYTIHKK